MSWVVIINIDGRKVLMNEYMNRHEYISPASECFGEQQAGLLQFTLLIPHWFWVKEVAASPKLTLQGCYPFLQILSHYPSNKKLHWLPVRCRVKFKIGLITYKILNQGQPVYLRELIHPYSSSRNTRRSTPKLKFLQTPTFDRRVHKSIKHFSNSFSHYAPSLWNSFPFHVRNSPSVASFRKHLKTHLFSSSFPT